jgi:hypothetical protein
MAAHTIGDGPLGLNPELLRDELDASVLLLDLMLRFLQFGRPSASNLRNFIGSTLALGFCEKFPKPWLNPLKFSGLSRTCQNPLE